MLNISSSAHGLPRRMDLAARSMKPHLRNRRPQLRKRNTFWSSSTRASLHHCVRGASLFFLFFFLSLLFLLWLPSQHVPSTEYPYSDPQSCETVTRMETGGNLLEHHSQKCL